MRVLYSLFFTVALVFAQDVDIKGNVGVEYKKYDYKMPIPNKYAKSLNSELELESEYENYIGYLKVEALEDEDEQSRDYIKINEVYIKAEFDDIELKAGKYIKFWGALELHNLTDIYNKKNTQRDPYDKDKKLGEESLTVSKYLENEDEISVIVGEEKYFKFSGSRDDFASRDFSFLVSSKDDKFLTYHSAVVEDTIYKVEASYTTKVKNYYEVGAGIEHTLYQVFDKKDLGILLEYYKSDKKTLAYQDDIFAGVRVTFNDKDDSDIVAGVIEDKESSKSSVSFEYNTRVNDKFKVQVTYLKNTAFKVVGLNIRYYF